jgi:hypothetical protein
MREPPPSPSPEPHPKELEQKAPAQPIDPVGAQSAPEKPPALEAEPRPIEVTPEDPREPVQLEGDELALPGGLILRDVPKRSRVFVRSTLDVWEIFDARDRLVLRVRASPLRTVARPANAPLLEAAQFSDARELRNDWGPKPVRIVVTRFSSETHLYTLERLATGTEWAWKGLEIDVTRK